MIDRKKYKKFARMQLKGRWTVPVLMTLTILLLELLFSLPDLLIYPYKEFIEVIKNNTVKEVWQFYQTNFTTHYPYLNWILTFVLFIPSFAAAKVYIKLSQSPEPVSFTNYIRGFNYWLRGLGVGLWKLLWLFLWAMTVIPVMLLISFIFGIIAVMFNTSSFDIDKAFVAPITIVSIILIIAVVVIIIIKSISYSMTEYIAAEHEKCSIKSAMKISIKITKGHLWDIFVLELSFIGWSLLSMITFGISRLWITPYYEMTMVNTYHALLKMAFEENKIFVEDFEK